MANIMSLVKLKNKPSRNGFDLSRKNLFSAKVSEILPVCCIECLPGDKAKIRTSHFTRTAPLNSAGYARIQEYHDWFFVPTNLLWNRFNTFITQMGDNGQQAVSIDTNVVIDKQHPYIERHDIFDYLNSISSSAVQDQPNGLTIFGHERNLACAKLLHYLNYGRFTNQNGTEVLPQPDTPNYAMTPFPLLAYQKIYSDFYRNSQWEKSFAPSFNINYMTGATTATKKIPIRDIREDIESMFELRYSNWSKDYFMGVLPNSQYGDAASVNISSLLGDVSSLTNLEIRNSSAANSDVTTNANRFAVAGSSSQWQMQGQVGFSLSKQLGLTSGSLIGAFSILALRNAEAMQKWAEITQSHQQDYKSQIEAHWNVHVSDALSERCTYVAGSRANVNIGEVINTNLSTDESMALVKGKGEAAGEDFTEFSTDVHGYLMCIYHATPSLDYAINGIPKMNLKTNVLDYANPEYDKTGMVQVPLAELSPTFDKISLANGTSRLLGYAPRYYEYKTAYDEVHGAFVDGGYQSWVVPFSEAYINQYLQNLGSVPIGKDLLNYVFFKINPSIMNGIFGKNADSYTDTDQLFVNQYIDAKFVRNLDRNGLPY